MAEDDTDRARETEAERNAEITSELERVDQDPDTVSDGSDNLGTQSAASGTPREEDNTDAENDANDEAPTESDDQ